jgi:protein-S-isoprenylcysteine O-methyltransferase Ste14
MTLIPQFGCHLLNGWLYLVAYFLGLFLTVIAFTAEKRKALFHEPGPPRGSPAWLALLLGRLCAVTYVILMFFTPLRTGTAFFIAGTVVYVAGYALVVLSLLEFRRAAPGHPVTAGLYRFSRNPQWIGLVLVFLGTTIAVATWLQLALVLVLVGSYHFQILAEEEACLQYYGEEYRAYLDQVPRYILF